MAFVSYAASTDLTGDHWIAGAAPANVDVLLRYATIRVARACNLQLLDTPGDVDPALRDATCAQVASWIALGVDPAKGGTDLVGAVKKSAILNASVERDTSAQAKAATAATTGLCEDAIDILFVAGLLWLPGDVEIADGGGCWPEATEGYYWPGLPEWPFF